MVVPRRAQVVHLQKVFILIFVRLEGNDVRPEAHLLVYDAGRASLDAQPERVQRLVEVVENRSPVIRVDVWIIFDPPEFSGPARVMSLRLGVHAVRTHPAELSVDTAARP